MDNKKKMKKIFKKFVKFMQDEKTNSSDSEKSKKESSDENSSDNTDSDNVKNRESSPIQRNNKRKAIYTSSSESEIEMKPKRRVILRTPSPPSTRDKQESVKHRNTITYSPSPTPSSSKRHKSKSPSPERYSPSIIPTKATDNITEIIIKTIKKQCSDKHIRERVCKFFNSDSGCKARVSADHMGRKCTTMNNIPYYHSCSACLDLLKAHHNHTKSDCTILKIFRENNLEHLINLH